MKETNYQLIVGVSQLTNEDIYRRVWEHNGEYYVSFNCETILVSSQKDNFIED